VHRSGPLACPLLRGALVNAWVCQRAAPCEPDPTLALTASAQTQQHSRSTWRQVGLGTPGASLAISAADLPPGYWRFGSTTTRARHIHTRPTRGRRPDPALTHRRYPSLSAPPVTLFRTARRYAAEWVTSISSSLALPSNAPTCRVEGVRRTPPEGLGTRVTPPTVGHLHSAQIGLGTGERLARSGRAKWRSLCCCGLPASGHCRGTSRRSGCWPWDMGRRGFGCHRDAGAVSGRGQVVDGDCRGERVHLLDPALLQVGVASPCQRPSPSSFHLLDCHGPDVRCAGRGPAPARARRGLGSPSLAATPRWCP
jgi:hypothetical protein